MIAGLINSQVSIRKEMLWMVIMSIILCACNNNQANQRFETLSSEKTGINFINELNPTKDLNIFNYLYFYDGGGVAAGDLNGDGLSDLYFTANQGENKLYLNKSELVFEDVTDEAFDTGIDDWSTGVSLVDINDDGKLDIYLSNVGDYLTINGVNKLFINKGNTREGIPVFEEQAKEYGLDLIGFSTQSAFFDYDQDGDLDMFMMNHSVHSNATFDYASIRTESHPLGGDRLFRNDEGQFIDVTEQAGIYNSAVGYGLGLGISDINNDGYPDIYIGNDFHEDDYFYMNNGDGTFTESLKEMMPHTSRSSMGNDLMDINNDGLVDILSVDMLPRNYEMLKTSAAEDPYEIYQTKLKYGYKNQFSRNTLQLNRGDNKFSDIGLLADIYATDWSWASLGADFNHNGYTDLFISNGIKGRTNDLDYISFISQDHIQERLEGEMSEKEVELTQKMPAVKVPNNMFVNNGELKFEDVSEDWGLNHPTYSSGAAYSDLDGDGDLEIILNNVDQQAMVLKNNTMEKFKNNNYIKFKLEGPKGNRHGIGTKITVPLENGETIIREFFPVRGYQSSVDYGIHIGLDTLTSIPNVKVQWPDGEQEILSDVSVNQTVTVAYDHSEKEKVNIAPPSNNRSSENKIFTDISNQLNISFNHEENDFVEFNREALIPHMISKEGPAIAVGDVNGDGLDDIYTGGAKRQQSRLYLQQREGTFKEKANVAFESDFIYEDVDALFTDIDGDNDNDLVVVSGGNEYYGRSEYMQPRLYINDGAGNFIRDTENFPELYLTGSVVAGNDIDHDGDIDLFIGARAIPWKYGMSPTSYLLINEKGSFRVADNALGKTCSSLGMVTDATWEDMDGDDYPDLVVASEWEDLKVVYNQSSERITSIPNTSGLWNSIETADLDGDGNYDIVAGNLGLNSKYKASAEKPISMYVNDFDNNGSVEQVITYIDDEGEERLFATKDELGNQLDYIHERFESYSSFAKASLTEVIDESLLRNSTTYQLKELQSSIFYNRNGQFKQEPLPIEAQFAPIYDHLIFDFTQNSHNDLLAVGNNYDANIQRGRYDASYGSLMANSGDSTFVTIPNSQIDWFMNGQYRKVETLIVKGKTVLLLAENDGPLHFFEIDNESSHLLTNKK